MKKVKIIIIVFILLLTIPIGINIWMINKYQKDIFATKDINDKYDIGMILGCSVLKDGRPSLMLRDRLDKGIELYNKGIVEYLLISGDHSDDYSEINTMYDYLIENGIDKNKILIDKKGHSTSRSLLNYNKKYNDKSLIIITQEYHLYRAIYIAKKINIKAIGVYAEKINYNGQSVRDIREFLARCKDFVKMNYYKIAK
jgi:vancomycin permeability regulator SanA